MTHTMVAMERSNRVDYSVQCGRLRALICAYMIATLREGEWVHFRWACPKFLRQTFHEWAAHSIPYSAWAQAYYQQQIAKGNGHHAAVRSLRSPVFPECGSARPFYRSQQFRAAG